jgi:hypothetical protein
MPSPKFGGRGRSSIPSWRVKEGKKSGELFAGKKGECEQWIRDHQKEYKVKLRAVPPN